jgi:monoamine oxidase
MVINLGHMTEPTARSSGGGETADRGGNTVTPFTKAAESAVARRRREQQALKDTVNAAAARRKELERARQKKLEEEAAAMKAADIAQEDRTQTVEDSMDLDKDAEDEDSDLENIVRDLDKEVEKEISSPLEKRSRNKEDSRNKAPSQVVTNTATSGQSSFIPHNYSNPRVIVEGSARLTSDDKVAQFIGLVGTLLANGKMVDPFFVLNPTIIGGGRKDLHDAKDVP